MKYPECNSWRSDPDEDGYGWENGETCLVPMSKSEAEKIVAAGIEDGSIVATREDINTRDIGFALEMMSDDNPSDDNYWRMIYDMGGAYEYNVWEKTASKDEISNLKESYNLAVLEETPATPGVLRKNADNQMLSFCGERFADKYIVFPWWRNRINGNTPTIDYWTGSHKSYLDYEGRPFIGHMETALGYYFNGSWGFSGSGQVQANGNRSSTCQSNVGSMGVKLPPVTNYYYRDQGGHLVPHAMGGAAKRVNLVPTAPTINNWIGTYMEAPAKQCMNNGTSAVVYEQVARYSNSSTLRPSVINVKFSVNNFRFPNATKPWTVVRSIVAAVPKSLSFRIPNKLGDLKITDKWIHDSMKSARLKIWALCAI